MKIRPFCGLVAIMVALLSNGPSGDASPPVAPMSRDLDVDAVVRRVEHGFKASASGGFAAEARGWASVVDSDGSLTVSRRATAGGGLRFTTSSIRRGNEELWASAQRMSLRSDGAVVFGRGRIEETFEETPSGVEQSWIFPERPGSTGDLEVRVRVPGVSGVETPGGVDLVEDTRLARVGSATWVDAHGTRSPVALAWDAASSALVLNVPAAVLETSAFPAVLDPLVSPEIGMDQAIPGRPTHAWSPAIAFDGTNFLVVWCDERRELDGLTVYGARVSPSGTVLDPVGFEIGLSLQPLGVPVAPPAIAFNGTSFLVVWEDHRHDDGSDHGDIHAARVTTAGTVLDASDIVVASTSATESSPAVATDGTNWIVAWSAAGEIQTARVGPNGNVLSSLMVPSGANSRRTSPTLTYNGTSFLVAWRAETTGLPGDSGVWGRRIAPNGTMLDASSFKITSDLPSAPGKLASASDGTGYVVGWSDGTQIRAARVSSSGAVQDSPAITVSTGANERTAPTASFDGTSYVFAWADFRSGNLASGIPLDNVYAARVTPGGTVSDPQGVIIDNEGSSALVQTMPAVAFGAGHSLVVFEQMNLSQPTFHSSIYGGRFSVAGAALDQAAGFHLSTSSNRQRTPSVAFDGTNYLVVWEDVNRVEDAPNGLVRSDVRGVRVAQDGTILDANAITIVEDAGAGCRPVATFDGTNFLVVWTTWGKGGFAVPDFLLAARVSTGGTVLDPGGFSVSAYDEPDGHLPEFAVASGAGESLVVFPHQTTGDADQNIYAVRISSAGKTLDASGIRVTTALGAQDFPGVAFDGTNFVVVWEDPRADVNSPATYGARVTPTGTVLEPPGIALSSGAASFRPAVACAGGGCFTAWLQGSGADEKIAGARLTGATVLDVASLPLKQGDHLTPPAVAWDGTQYLVSWGHGSAFGLGLNASLEATTVLPDGGAQAAFAIEADAAFSRFLRIREREPVAAVSANALGETIVAYSRLDTAAPYGAFRVRARFVGAVPSAVDGGSPDAGTSDAGANGTPPNPAPSQDGGAPAPTSSGGGDDDGGCRIGMSKSTSGGAWSLGFLVLLVLRRRAGAARRRARR